ncbi:MAG: hypothetical protein AUH85_05010 [Chloroflexi bacterium 13_1_40CM_4_68_4]|nr:MAG: hypothetical protein AUH85_05010 [Chloroflexi bacterium 13_1_40CM_4_68_4]
MSATVDEGDGAPAKPHAQSASTIAASDTRDDANRSHIGANSRRRPRDRGSRAVAIGVSAD